MAKIKSPLLMADGARVRTMEELREHFDIASVLAYYDNGKLREWLENYYYDAEADEVGKLDSSSADIKEKLCGILGVSCPVEETGNISLADISDKNRRLNKLKKFTSDDEFLRAADYVAFTQEELQGLLDAGAKKIYLCQEEGEFEIPDTEGVTYIGVNHPFANTQERFGEKGIVFQNVDIGIEGVLRSAREYSENKNYAEAVKIWTEVAVLGNAEAQRELGRCYHKGEGVTKDYAEACKWYGKAAEQGDACAQVDLGNCYYNGNGVTLAYGEAVKWYRKAAEKGYAEAQKRLGICYKKGKGVKQDYGEAVKWYREAAEQGDADAQYNLGRCYHLGNGIAKDSEKAIEWYKKSAEQGNAAAQNMLDVYDAGGNGAAQNEGEICRQYRKAAEQGDAEAQWNLGNCYYHGNGVAKNYYEARGWYEKAAGQGYAQAQCSLGDCYYHGNGETKDYYRACKWYRKAAEQKYAIAQRNLGDCYYYGNGANKNKQEACKWYRKAAEQGDVYAQRMAGECYYYGYGVAQNYTEACKWYKKAAKQGDADAQAMLDTYYAGGKGADRHSENIEKAKPKIDRKKEFVAYVENCKKFLDFIQRMLKSWNACNGELNSHKGRVQYARFMNNMVNNLSPKSHFGHMIYDNMCNLSAFAQTMFRRYKELEITEIYMNGDPNSGVAFKVNSDISVDWNDEESNTLEKEFEKNIYSVLMEANFSLETMEANLFADTYDFYQSLSMLGVRLGTYQCLFKRFFDSLLKALDGNDEMLEKVLALSEQYPTAYDKGMENVLIWKYADKGPYIEIKDGNQKYKYETALIHFEAYETTTLLIHFRNMPLSNYTTRYNIVKNEYTEYDFTNFASTTHSLAEVEWGDWVSTDVCELKITKNSDNSLGELIIEITVDEVESAVAVIKSLF